MRRVLLAVFTASTLTLAACAPPPPTLPPKLPGNPHWEGVQAIIHAVCSVKGCVPECELYLRTEIDLQYTVALVTSNVTSSGICARTDWTGTTATMTCVSQIGSATCGERALPVGTLRVQVFLKFDPIPAVGRMRTFSQASYHGQGGEAEGLTPTFKCSPTEIICKFQEAP